MQTAVVQAHTDAQQDPALLRRLLRVKDRIDAALYEAWPVRRLAEVSDISAAHLARSFKQAFGTSPHRYLPTHRIEQATTLLRDTDLPIIEIAYTIGWENLGTFGRIFRDIIGQSPSTLRRHVQATVSLQQLDHVPACVLKVAQRPDLVTAVLEGRRQLVEGTNPSPTNNKER